MSSKIILYDSEGNPQELDGDAIKGLGVGGLVPTGGIIMYQGLVVDIPANFELMPEMVDKMPLGTVTSIAGGENSTQTVTIPATSSASAGTPSGAVELDGVDGAGKNISAYVKLGYIKRVS